MSLPSPRGRRRPAPSDAPSSLTGSAPRLRPGAAIATALVVLAAGACSSGSGDGPDDLADELARGLAARDLDDVSLSSASARRLYERAVRNVGEVSTTVDVTEIRESGDSATATLSWAWDLGRAEWRYTTRAELSRDGDRWEVEWNPSTLAPGLRSGEQLDLDELPADRGDILGAGGEVIVTDRPVVRYGLDKAQVPEKRWGSSAVRIARSLGVDEASYRRTVLAYGEEAFVEAIVLRAEEARSRVDADYGAIPGAVAIDDAIPLAPTREFAAPVVGTVGPATAEIIERSGGAVEEGDVVGYSGLQARYDERLRGRSGVRVQAVDRDGSERTIFTAAAKDGDDLTTTLDITLQQRAEQALADHVGTQGPDSALVAVRPSTGEVLAAANGPGNEGLNVATAGRYAPGSTFKTVSALAMLRAGATPETVGSCPSTTVVDGRRFKNYDDYPSDRLGEITLQQAVANSCNTFFINAWDDLPQDALAEAAAALGLGVDHDLGFPAYFGQVPPASGDTEKAAALIGQGKILASPLAMAGVAASVAAGHAVLPQMLPDHQVTQTEPGRPLTQVEAEQLRAMMRAVVTEGSAGFLGDLPQEVGAKTGTAEYGEPAADGSLKTHAWMIATQGDLAVAVFVETGESGSQTAGPILAEFLS